MYIYKNLFLLTDVGLFATVILEKLCNNIPKDINLYKPIENKMYFHELEVSDNEHDPHRIDMI